MGAKLCLLPTSIVLSYLTDLARLSRSPKRLPWSMSARRAVARLSQRARAREMYKACRRDMLRESRHRRELAVAGRPLSLPSGYGSQLGRLLLNVSTDRGP